MTRPSSSGAIETKVNRGIAWVGLASSLVSLLDTVALFIILKLWVSKEEYGVAVLAISWCPTLDLIADLGLSAAVIQRDDPSRAKISTVFWLNLILSAALCATVDLGVGPFIAW